MKLIKNTEKKKILLNLLKEFHNICEKNNITYFLAFGTLLGAIRHNGFIPWDDDVDVIMTYDDIEKLRNIKIDGYTYIDCCTNINYPLSYGKFYQNKTILKEESYAFKNLEIGINIDVFPIIKIDSIKFQNKRTELNTLSKNYVHKSLKSIKGDTFIKNIIKELIHKTKHKISFNKNANEINDIVLSCAGKDKVLSFCEWETKLFSINSFDKKELHQFENLELYIPSEYDHILTVCYGNYMIPMKNKQSTHVNKAYKIE